MAADDDAPFLEALGRATPASWTELWAALDGLDGVEEFATWAGGEVIDTAVVDGVERPVIQVPYPIYSEAVERLRAAIGGCGLVVPFDWMQWDGNRRYRGGVGLDGAPVADAVRMVTAVVRSERFGDGSIEGALRDGTLQAALARLRVDHG